MAKETFLGRAFERFGAPDVEEIFGGRNEFGKMCELCEGIDECRAKGHRCGGKSIILLMATNALVRSGPYPLLFAEMLRDTVSRMSKTKAARDNSNEFQTTESAPCSP